MDFRTEARVLGLLALAFALFGIFAPYRWHEMPSYLTLIALIVAGLLGIAAVWEYIRHKFKLQMIITDHAITSLWIAGGLLLIAGGATAIWHGIILYLNLPEENHQVQVAGSISSPAPVSTPPQAQDTQSPEPSLPPNAKFRYRGKVFWAAPRPYIKVQAEEMQKALQEVYDSIIKNSEPIVSSWDGPAVTFTRNWLSIVQTEGRQSAIVKLDDIRNQVISAYTELGEILKRRPYYRQDISSIINDHGEVGDMNGAINDYKAALAALPDEPKPTTDLINRVIGPSEVKFEMAITKYTNWIYAFNTKTLQLREELDALTNE